MDGATKVFRMPYRPEPLRELIRWLEAHPGNDLAWIDYFRAWTRLAVMYARFMKHRRADIADHIPTPGQQVPYRRELSFGWSTWSMDKALPNGDLRRRILFRESIGPLFDRGGRVVFELTKDGTAMWCRLHWGGQLVVLPIEVPELVSCAHQIAKSWRPIAAAKLLRDLPANSALPRARLESALQAVADIVAPDGNCLDSWKSLLDPSIVDSWKHMRLRHQEKTEPPADWRPYGFRAESGVPYPDRYSHLWKPQFRFIIRTPSHLARFLTKLGGG
jgi:hypothetical protein